MKGGGACSIQQASCSPDIIYCHFPCLHAGTIYLDDCDSLESNIPIFLIVFGCVSLLQTIINIAKRLCGTKKKDDETADDEEASAFKRCGSCIESVLSLFLLAWIITGSVWVFGHYNEWMDHKDRCNNTVYIFSFVILVLIYVFSGLICCCCCCMFCIIALAAGED